MGKKLIYLAPFVLVLGLFLAGGAKAADPDLIGWWPLNEGSGNVVADLSGGGNDGTIQNADTGGLGDGGSVWVDDPERGTVISFNGTAQGAFVRAGSIPQMTLTNDFTWSFWAKQKAENTANNDIILGNRKDENAVDFVPRQFIKFTPTKFEWHMNGNGNDNLEYEDIPADVWLHHAVVKAADQLTYYRNGVEASSGKFTQPMDLPQPLFFGGDNEGAEGENWSGLMSDVRIYNRALTGLEVLALVKGVERIDMEIGFALKPPVIDGQVDYIWGGASTQSFVPLADPADGSGIWKVLYDAENLYVILDVTDDSLQNDSASSWQDDSVEIYFDGGNTKLSTPLSGDDHQYTFGWTADDIQGTNITGYTEGIEQAQVTTDAGWRIEVKMPWMSIWGVVPQALDLIGIDCYYNDDDDGGDSREGKMLGFSAVEGWNDASQWGTAVLAAMPEPVNPGAEGLIAHYAFENDTADSSGSGLNGTAIGDPTFVAGVEGMALDLNGNDYLDCGGVAEFSFTDAMTVSTWVNIRSVTTAWMAMVAKGENAWRLGFNNLTTGVHYAFSGGTRGWQAANTATELAFDEWYHVAATYDTTVGAIVYINGVPDASNSNLDGIDVNQKSLLIGDNPEATGRLLDGMLDEVMIYNRALSDGEILYLAGMRVPVDPVHSYTFEDGTGNDSIGEADGVFMGDASIVDGALVVDGNGDWMEMPGDVIAINTYSEMTLELWSTQSVDNPFSMTASFGGTWSNGMGKDYIFIATGRGDQMNRGAIANTPDEVNPWEDEVGVSSPELNDGIEHHYVLTITAAELAYYVDGVPVGTAPMGGTTISGVSNDFVFLGKGIYSVDATMNCSINEFNIYDVALSAKQIAASYAAGPVK